MRIPAPTANLGPGYDCLGLALAHYNEVTLSPAEAPRVTIEGEGADVLPRDESNLVLEAARALPDVHFDLVGGGDRLEEVRAAAEGLDNVAVPGRVSYAEVWEHVGAASVCLVPFSLSDLTHRVSPIKLFEYWAAGRPVVVSRTVEMQACAGAAVLYADGGAELAAQISKLHDDRDLRRKLAAAGRERVREFDWQVIGARYLSIFGRLFREGSDA